MLISQPGSDYQLTRITLDAGHARDITCLLLDIHAVLDQLHLDGTQPEITSTAEAILRESDSPDCWIAAMPPKSMCTPAAPASITSAEVCTKLSKSSG